VLVVLPVVLALCGYYRAQLAGAPLPRPRGDAAFYAYQLTRAALCHGQWWRVAHDGRLGHPYPSEFAKHPGLFEGVDLMLLATLFAGAVSAAWAYHLSVMAALAVNGWIAGWIVKKTTRSTLWAMVAVALVTVNESVAVRVLVHLHLFKFGWALLAVWAFVAFLKQPAWWRGLILGLAVALELQASFYLGFFTALGLGFGYAVELVAGRVPRRALAPAILAAVVAMVAGGFFCFPVWTNYSPIVGSDQYFHRYWAETWIYGSEVWKYFVPKDSWLASNYFRDLRHKVPAPIMDEGWNFPGYTVLVAVLVAGVAWLRRSELSRKLHTFVWVSLGLMAFWAMLSLAGGPSALIFHAIPSFRCYGRAGLLVVALGAVVAPIVMCELVRTCRRRAARVTLTLGLLALAIFDLGHATSSFKGWPTESTVPAWVEWLRPQPPDTRLAVFMAHPPTPITPAEAHGDNEPFYWWGVQALEWLPLHGHATVAGGEFTLFEGDLRLLGASYDQINPAAVRFVASLGYETFAFHRDYLAANSWIARAPCLNRIDERGEWQFYRSNPDMIKLPTTSLEQFLVKCGNQVQRRVAPPYCWVTGSLPVEEDTLVTGNEWALLAWTDAGGRLRSQPQPALYQHVFGPCIPAYTIRTPSEPGSYRLVVYDRRLQPRATIGYQIVPNLTVSQPQFPARRPDVTVHPVRTLGAKGLKTTSFIELELVNDSGLYLQAQVFRQHMNAVAQTHPGLRSPWLKASDGGMVLSLAPADAAFGSVEAAREIPLAQDLPAGGRLKVRIPTDRLPPFWASLPLLIEPSFIGVGRTEALPERADLKISIAGSTTDIARRPGAAEIRSR